MTASKFFRLTLAIGAVLAAVAVALAWALGSGEFALGAVVGAGLGLVNLAALAWLCGRTVGDGERRGLYAALLGVKFAALIAVVFVVVKFVPMDTVGFVIGMSPAALAVVGSSSYLAVRRLELQ